MVNRFNEGETGHLMTLPSMNGVKSKPRVFLFFKYILEGYTVACRERDADNEKDTSGKSGDGGCSKMLNEIHIFKVMSIL